MKIYSIDKDFANFLKFASEEMSLPGYVAYYLKNKVYKKGGLYSSYEEEYTTLNSIIIKDDPKILIEAKVGNAKNSTIIAKKVLEAIENHKSINLTNKIDLKKNEHFFNISANIKEKLANGFSQNNNVYSLANEILLSDVEFEDLKKLAIRRLSENSSFHEEKALPFLNAISQHSYGAAQFFNNEEIFRSLYIGPIFMNNLYFDTNRSDYYDYSFASNFVKNMKLGENDSEKDEPAKINYVVYETLNLIDQGMSFYKEDSNWAKLALRALNAILKCPQFKLALENNINNNDWRVLIENIKSKNWELSPELKEFMKINLILENVPEFFTSKEIQNDKYNESLYIDENNFYKNFQNVYKMNSKETMRTFFKKFQDFLAISSNVELSDILIGNSKSVLELSSNEPIDTKYIKYLLENFVDLANKYNNFNMFLKEPNKDVIMTDLSLRLQQKYLEDENQVVKSKKQRVLKF